MASQRNHYLLRNRLAKLPSKPWLRDNYIGRANPREPMPVLLVAGDSERHTPVSRMPVTTTSCGDILRLAHDGGRRALASVHARNGGRGSAAAIARGAIPRLAHGGGRRALAIVLAWMKGDASRHHTVQSYSGTPRDGGRHTLAIILTWIQPYCTKPFRTRPCRSHHFRRIEASTRWGTYCCSTSVCSRPLNHDRLWINPVLEAETGA